VRTHHKFRKIRSFLRKKVRTFASEESPISFLPWTSPPPPFSPWLRTSLMDGPKPLIKTIFSDASVFQITSVVLRLGRSCHQIFSAFFFWASPQCHLREPPNQVSHLEGGTGDRRLVCYWPFVLLLRICSSPRAPSPLCVLLSGTVQYQYIGDLFDPGRSR